MKKELVFVFNTEEDLLEETEIQLDVLAEDYKQAGCPESSKNCREAARKICRLRVMDKFLNGTIAEYEEYLKHSQHPVNQAYNSGVVSGLRKTLLHLHGK